MRTSSLAHAMLELKETGYNWEEFLVQLIEERLDRRIMTYSPKPSARNSA